MLRAGVVYRMYDHPQQWQRFERREKASDRQPVTRRPDPEVVMSETKDPGAEDESHLDVKPRLDNSSRGAEQLHQGQGHNATDQDLPGGLNPEVDEPPPPEQVGRHVADRRKGDQIEQD